jgi:hypothetical protein
MRKQNKTAEDFRFLQVFTKNSAGKSVYRLPECCISVAGEDPDVERRDTLKTAWYNEVTVLRNNWPSSAEYFK